MMRLLAVLYLLFFAGAAEASPIIADLSYHMIAIDSSFKGTSLLMFGARGDAGDIVIAVRGPEAEFTVRRKERHAGIWVNSATVRFKHVPRFYTIASTRPLTELGSDELLRRLRIGTDDMKLESDSVRRDVDEFRTAFKDDRARQGLFTPIPKTISFMSDTLFKTFIDFPDKTPNGNYTAEVYLIHNGQLVSMQSTPIRVRREGTEAMLYNVAHNWPLTYGIIAVAMAFILGWAAAAAFRRI